MWLNREYILRKIPKLYTLTVYIIRVIAASEFILIKCLSTRYYTDSHWMPKSIIQYV